MQEKAEDFFNTCLNKYRLAFASFSIQRQYLIGECAFTITYASPTLYEYFGKAIAHLEIIGKNLVTRTFSIYVGDRNAVGALPKPFWNWGLFTSSGNIYDGKPRYTSNYDVLDKIFRMVDNEGSKAIVWIEDMKHLPYWYRSFPFRTEFDWFFSNSSMQPIHAAALTHQNEGVLLVGKGGSGKSNTALNCLINSDLGYLGDDFVLADSQELTIHSLYNVAKLEHKDVPLYPLLQSVESFTGPREDQKIQIFTHDFAPDQLVKKTNLKAILLSRVSPNVRTTIVEVPGETVLNELASSTLELLKGDRIKSFKKIQRLVAAAPCGMLLLGSERESIPNTIKNFLAN